MNQWDWLEKPLTPPNWRFIVRVILKALALFIVVNIAFALFVPLEGLGKFSLYHTILPGRTRLPYGENPDQSYSVSMDNIPAMFASHLISRSKAPDEYRVFFIGDSSTWGWLLPDDATLTAQINAGRHITPDGKRLTAYNLGYPIMSLSKDLLILDYAMQYQPDMIVWLVTLESFPSDKQLFPPLVQNNAPRMRQLINTYDLHLNPDDERFTTPDFMQKTLAGQRRAIADWLRLQLYGFSWAATGIDQYIPADYPLRSSDFDANITWETFTQPQPLDAEILAFDVISAGIAVAGDVPVLLVNEPMFISDGQNSDLRYNAFYPRWAYDSYREVLAETAGHLEWALIDLWDSLSPAEFTDTPVHLTASGTSQLAELLMPYLIPLPLFTD